MKNTTKGALILIAVLGCAALFEGQREMKENREHAENMKQLQACWDAGNLRDKQKLYSLDAHGKMPTKAEQALADDAVRAACEAGQ